MLGTMKERFPYTRNAQETAMFGGLFFLYLGVDAAWKSYKLGKFEFDFTRLTSSGYIAALLTGACLVSGVYLIVTALRHHKDW